MPIGPRPGWLCRNYLRLVGVFRGQMRLDLFLRELRGQIDCRNHTVGPRDAFSRNIERGSVIGTGAGKGQTEGDVHAGMKGVQLQWNQTLIVIHAESGVPFPVSEMEEESVGRNGPFETRSRLVRSKMGLV